MSRNSFCYHSYWVISTQIIVNELRDAGMSHNLFHYHRKWVIPTQIIVNELREGTMNHNAFHYDCNWVIPTQIIQMNSVRAEWVITYSTIIVIEWSQLKSLYSNYVRAEWVMAYSTIIANDNLKSTLRFGSSTNRIWHASFRCVTWLRTYSTLIVNE